MIHVAVLVIILIININDGRSIIQMYSHITRTVSTNIIGRYIDKTIQNKMYQIHGNRILNCFKLFISNTVG